MPRERVLEGSALPDMCQRDSSKAGFATSVEEAELSFLHYLFQPSPNSVINVSLHPPYCPSGSSSAAYGTDYTL